MTPQRDFAVQSIYLMALVAAYQDLKLSPPDPQQSWFGWLHVLIMHMYKAGLHVHAHITKFTISDSECSWEKICHH